MKTKIAGLASTALLLLAPISGAFSAVAESQVVQAENNWDYDTADPGLGEYDRLLQNAGPSDGEIDWYPAEHFASSSNIRPSLLVKQLIDLSIATNDANSNARKVLFNDTTGSYQNPDYKDTYEKYNLAFGFIAQLLAFNNAKTGRGAYLKQGFESTDGVQPGEFHAEDIIAETHQNPNGRIKEIPAVGEGINISDVLGKAFFGNGDDAYAQLYVNGYDNTVQNAPNIIRETTTSITIVAQSKLTGRKATAIFKLNNKTFNNLPDEVLLENNIDNSPSFAGVWGHTNIPNTTNENRVDGDSTDGTFNQKTNLITGLTGDQRRLLSTGGSSAWVDPQTGSGTIVVPRGTSAAEIAKKIKQLGYKSNYSISNVAPMKAIHGDFYNRTSSTSSTLATAKNSYNVDHNEVNYTVGGSPVPANVTPLSNDAFNGAGKPENNYIAVADPRLENSNLGDKKLTDNFSNSLLASPFNTNDTGPGGINHSYDNTIANRIPDQRDATPKNFNDPKLDFWPAFDNGLGNSSNNAVKPSYNGTELNSTLTDSTYPFGGTTGAFGGNMLNSDKLRADTADDQLGDVVHAFEPSSGVNQTTSPFKVREAWDDTHAIFGTAPFTGLTEEEVKNQIANNGSFNNTSGDQIKKSFTFNMPLNNMVMKSYRNPYSTVISTALPFAKDLQGFEPNSEYTKGTGDMNSDSFKGNYLGDEEEQTQNPWYINYIGHTGLVDSSQNVLDNTGHEIVSNVRSINSLHLSSQTWPNKFVIDPSTDTEKKPAIENVDENGLNRYNDVQISSGTYRVDEYSNTDINNWVVNEDNSTIDDSHPNTKLKGKIGHIESRQTPGDDSGHAPIITDQGKYQDASNNVVWDRDFNVSTNWISTGGSSGYYTIISGNGVNKSDFHWQLAKNAGYILINASGLNEKESQTLSKYQIPDMSTSDNFLDKIKNYTSIENNLPKIRRVNDDEDYRGGLIGVMSIHGSNNDGSSVEAPIKQTKAGSIYNNLIKSNGMFLEAPGLNSTIKVDSLATDNHPKGEFATDTDLHYGLAWNDSSDLPQVKIQRSLNVQYLVPVSIGRKVTTEWHQTARMVDSSRSDGYRITRWVNTDYGSYGLYLGDVKLSTDKTDIEPTTNNGLKDLLPVNNQIAYTRVDQSYPHYDSELFDHGSNKEDVTVKRGNSGRNFVGTSTEKETTEKTIGSSDDYSIGIVKAPDKFFDGADGNSEFKAKPNSVTRSTENDANGKEGINRTADSPQNNNGMAIGNVKSYATLAQAYNVEINGKTAVGKADDNSKNKGDRVALVQQLLDNGGDGKTYYYIPSLPRLYEKWNEARINVVVYDKAAVPAPSKAETKPSFSTTDVSTGNDPFNVNLRPYTTVYDDGAVLKASDVPQNFKNLLTRELVAGNPDLVTSDGKVATEKLQQILVGAFLNSWQQNDGSFNQTDTGAGVNSPLYLYGGFGISNSDSKNSYSQWPDGYTTPNLSSSKYHEAVTNYPGDFYRGGKDLKTTGATVIKGIPATALKADVSKVDLSKAGTYPVVYTYTNPSNDKDSASITVPVTVTDGAAPVFAFQGGSDLTIKVGESFDRSAFKVVGSWQIFNKYQGDYDKLVNYEGIAKNSKGEPDVTISGDVDTQTPGIYQLTYKATSIGGAVTTMKRNITVLPKETTGSDWKVSDFASVGYINYVPNYGINVWNAPAGTFTGQRLTHGTSWKIFQKAVNSQGKVYYQVGKNQWIDGAYVSFTPVSTMQPLNGIVTINYVRGYGVNLWKAPKTTGGYYEGRKLQDGTKWKVFGIQDGFYKVGGNQWIQAKYAKFQAR